MSGQGNDVCEISPVHQRRNARIAPVNEAQGTALLVGHGLMNSSRLLERLAAHRWNYHSVFCYRDALTHLNTSHFALLLSEFHLPDGSARRLIPWLEGSQTTAYFSVQTGSVTWWLPALDRGRGCFGTPALRPGEFGRRLEESLHELVGLEERCAFSSVELMDSPSMSIRLGVR